MAPDPTPQPRRRHIGELPVHVHHDPQAGGIYWLAAADLACALGYPSEESLLRAVTKPLDASGLASLVRSINGRSCAGTFLSPRRAYTLARATDSPQGRQVAGWLADAFEELAPPRPELRA